jgi:hypothetical protein
MIKDVRPKTRLVRGVQWAATSFSTRWMRSMPMVGLHRSEGRDLNDNRFSNSPDDYSVLSIPCYQALLYSCTNISISSLIEVQSWRLRHISAWMRPCSTPSPYQKRLRSSMRISKISCPKDLSGTRSVLAACRSMHFLTWTGRRP